MNFSCTLKLVDDKLLRWVLGTKYITITLSHHYHKYVLVMYLVIKNTVGLQRFERISEKAVWRKTTH